MCVVCPGAVNSPAKLKHGTGVGAAVERKPGPLVHSFVPDFMGSAS